MRSSEYSDEFPRNIPRKFRENLKFGFPRNIPMKYRGRHIPRKTPTNIRGYIIAVREPLGILKIPRKEPLPSVFRRNFLGTVGSISSINTRTPQPLHSLHFFILSHTIFTHEFDWKKHVFFKLLSFLDRSTSFRSEHEIAYGRIPTRYNRIHGVSSTTTGSRNRYVKMSLL